MWTFVQSNGKFYDDGGNLVAIGYSGHGDGKNNPAMQDVRAVGPLPVGNYTFIEPHDTTTHGPYVLALQPDTITTAEIISLDRDPDSFLCHGDSIEHPGAASEGCLVLSRDIREQVWNSNDHYLNVVAELEDVE